MMNIKLEPVDTMVSLSSSPANVAELVNAVNGQNSNSSDGNQISAIVENHSPNSNSNTSNSVTNGTSGQTNGTSQSAASLVSSPTNTIVIDKSGRDLETTVISLAPAQPYPLAFAPAYDLSGQTQYTVQVCSVFLIC